MSTLDVKFHILITEFRIKLFYVFFQASKT